MTEFNKQAEMLAAMFALAGLLSNGKSEDIAVDLAKKLGKELISKFEDDTSGIAALKPKAKK